MEYPDMSHPEIDPPHWQFEAADAMPVPQVTLESDYENGEEPSGVRNSEKVDTSLVMPGDHEEDSTPDTAEVESPSAKLGTLAITGALTVAGSEETIEPARPASKEPIFIKDRTTIAETTGVNDSETDRPLTREQLTTDFERWKRDVPVKSWAREVSKLPHLSAVDQETLQGIGLPYMDLDFIDLRGDIVKAAARNGLTVPQLSLIRRQDEAFTESVKQHAAAYDIGEIDPHSHSVRAGRFLPDTNALDWHTDTYDSSVLRYVASVGTSGSTDFGSGTIRRSNVSDFGWLSPSIDRGPEGPFRQVNHGAGIISCFPGNYGLHKTPGQATGVRIFMSVDVLPETRRRRY